MLFKSKSIVFNTLIKMGLFLGAVVVFVTFITFAHVFETSKKAVIEQLGGYIQQRAYQEAEYLGLAHHNLSNLSKAYYLNRDTYVDEDLSQLSSIIEKRADGSLRSPWMSFDQFISAAVFVGDEDRLTKRSRGDLVTLHDLISRIGTTADERFPNLYFVSADDYLVMYWPQKLWSEQQDLNQSFTDQPFYFGLEDPSHKDSGIFWSPVYFNSLLDEWVVSALSPLSYHGDQVGSIGQDIPLSNLAKRVSNLGLEVGTQMIIDKDGNYIAHPEQLNADSPLAFGSTTQSLEDHIDEHLVKLLAKVTLNKSYVFEDDGHNSLLAAALIPNTDWLFVLDYPEQALRDKAFDRAKSVLILGIMALLVQLALLYWLLTYYIARPLQSFTSVIHRFSSNTNPEPLDSKRNDELGQLASSYNLMQDRIQIQMRELEGSHDLLEEKVEKRTQELRAANEALNDSLDELHSAQNQLIEAEKMAALGNLVAGVAHEINTPVGVAITANSLLSDSYQKLKDKFEQGKMSKQDFTTFLEQVLESQEMIDSNLQRSVRMIKSFKQIAVDQSTEAVRPFVVSDYINEVLLSLRPILKKTNHQIEIKGDSVVMMESYPGAFSQVITQLVMNSIEHGFDQIDSGHIEVDIRSDEDRLILSYSDNGCGMQEQQLKQLFDPFYTTKRGEGSSGLGTSVVYNLVTHKLKGNICSKSEVGKGLTYNLILPLNVNQVE